MKKIILFIFFCSIFPQLKDYETLSKKSLFSQVKYFASDEGPKNVLLGAFSGFCTFGLFELAKYFSSHYVLPRYQMPVSILMSVLPLVINALAYQKCIKNKDIIDDIATGEESLSDRGSGEKISSSSYKQFFFPDKKKIVARTCYHLPSKRIQEIFADIVGKCNKKSKEEMLSFLKSFSSSIVYDDEIIKQNVLHDRLHFLISSHDRHEDFTFSEVTQLIRLFLENNQYIKDNLVLLHPFLSDPYFSYCIKNKLHEYVDSFSIVFLAAYLKYDSQEEASAFFFTLISLMKEHEYLLDRFIFFARDSLYKFLKMNHLEDIILNYIKKTEEKRLEYINTIESKIVAIQQKIILQKKSLETFLSSIKIKNDAVARLQETIKIHLKKGLDHENYIVLKAEKEIESFMREILNFENRIKQVEEVIKTLHEEIVTYQAEIEKTKKEIALFPDLFKIATDIIAHGEGIHEEKN